jgi:hypothetical protein
MHTIKNLNNDGSTSYVLVTGRKFTIQPHPDVDGADIPGSIIAAALDTLNELADKTHDVQSDINLSRVGRNRQLDTLQRGAIVKMGVFHGQLADFEKDLQQQEREHLAIPPLLLTQTVPALEDIEVRQWWRGAAANQKEAVLLNAPTDAQCQRVLVAFLRSPIPAISDAETRMMQGAWANVRDAAAPEVREAIDGARRSLSWARGSLALIASIVYNLVLTYGERDATALLRLTQQDDDQRVRDGATIFGYASTEILRMQRLIAAERMGRQTA